MKSDKSPALLSDGFYSVSFFSTWTVTLSLRLVKLTNLFKRPHACMHAQEATYKRCSFTDTLHFNTTEQQPEYQRHMWM